MKILVVEDDDNSRVLQHTILEAGGHTVSSATNGKEALQRIAEQKPDMIISDIMMPEMDGYALCRAIKSDPELVRIPFVFYSATFTSPNDQQLAIELGGASFLIKPMDPDAFISSIESLMTSDVPAREVTVKPLDRDAMDVKYATVISQKLDKKVKELKQAHSQLALTQSRLQQIKESYRLAQKIALIGCWDLNVSTGEFWWSDELYSMLDAKPDSTPPTREKLLQCVDPEDRDRFERALRMAEEKAIPFHMEHRIIGNDQQVRLVRSATEIAAFNPGNGRPARLVSVIQDITRQRAMEEEKALLELSLRQGQKIQALGSLASSIAHDFNNILTTIVANAELLSIQSSSLSEDDREYMGDILDACHRAAELVGQIKTFSRQEKLQKQPTDLADLIKEVLRLNRTSLPANITIDTHIQPGCPKAMANATQIHQVIMNLMVNAIQAMTPHGGKIEIHLEPIRVAGWDAIVREGLKAGEYILMKISDTGVGIDEKVKDRIFEPYFTTKQHAEGTGLGLSVVHGIILEHSGQISVTSAHGKGATFLVYLPACT